MTVCGITFVARDDVSDLFMEKVAVAVSTIFTINDDTDTLLQRELFSSLYRYRTVIHLFYSKDWNLSSLEEHAWNETSESNNICDIIMAGVPNPVMEIVEHILHHLTDIAFIILSPKTGVSLIHPDSIQ